MDAAAARTILVQHEPVNLFDAVQPVLRNNKLRDDLVVGSFAKDETFRYNCVRVMFRAMAKRPDLFYPYWDQFALAIDSLNGFHRSVGAQALAHLTSVDKECKLDRIFSHYLGLLDDSKVMVSHYFLETLPLIYRARPDLQGKIVTCLLDFDKTKHPPSRKEMLKADVINALEQAFDTLAPAAQAKAADFIKDQLASKSPKARNRAKAFVKKHP